MLRPDFPIKTERLVLRPYEPEDFDAALSYWSDPGVTRFLYLEAFTPETFVERLGVLMGRTELNDEGDVMTLAIVPDDVGQVVGDVTLFWRSAEHQAGEIGFILHPDHRSKGYAREASIPLLEMGFGAMKLHRMIGRLDGRNAASGKVLSGLGMRQEAHLVENEWVKGEWTDEIVYAMLRDEWLERQSAQA